MPTTGLMAMAALFFSGVRIGEGEPGPRGYAGLTIGLILAVASIVECNIKEK
jgi:hypothetical protein